jgi:hypothetical protein
MVYGACNTYPRDDGEPIAEGDMSKWLRCYRSFLQYLYLLPDKGSPLIQFDSGHGLRVRVPKLKLLSKSNN